MFYIILLVMFFFFFVMLRRPPRSTRTDTLFPYTTLFRSAGQAGGEGDGVLFSDADIKIASRKALLEVDQAAAFAPGRRDTDQATIGLSHVSQPMPEFTGERLLGRPLGCLTAHAGVELTRTRLTHWTTAEPREGQQGGK